MLAPMLAPTGVFRSILNNVTVAVTATEIAACQGEALGGLRLILDGFLGRLLHVGTFTARRYSLVLGCTGVGSPGHSARVDWPGCRGVHCVL
jgi:hypothetical protein